MSPGLAISRGSRNDLDVEIPLQMMVPALMTVWISATEPAILPETVTCVTLTDCVAADLEEVGGCHQALYVFLCYADGVGVPKLQKRLQYRRLNVLQRHLVVLRFPQLAGEHRLPVEEH